MPPIAPDGDGYARQRDIAKLLASVDQSGAEIRDWTMRKGWTEAAWIKPLTKTTGWDFADSLANLNGDDAAYILKLARYGLCSAVAAAVEAAE